MSPLQLHAKARPSRRKYGTVPGQGRGLLATAPISHWGRSSSSFSPSVSTFSVSARGVKTPQNAQGLYPWER